MNNPSSRPSQSDPPSPSSRVKIPRFSLPTINPEKLKSFLVSQAPRPTRSQLQILFRTWVASVCCMVLVVDEKGRRLLGGACYFPALAIFVLPPSVPLQLYFLSLTTMILGALTGWGISSLGMFLATIARDPAVISRVYRAARGLDPTNAASKARFTQHIWNGDFLEGGSTAVYGIFFTVGCFFFAWIRTVAPTLALFSSGKTSAFIDVVFVYGPLFPVADYSVAQILFVSLGIFCGITTTSIILLFPHSLAHEHMDLIAYTLSTLGSLTKDMSAIFEIAHSSNDTAQERVGKLDEVASRMGIQTSAMWKALSQVIGQEKLLDLEASYGIFSAKDIQSLGKPLKNLATHSVALKICSEHMLAHLREEEEKQATTSKPTAQHHSSLPTVSESASAGEVPRLGVESAWSSTTTLFSCRDEPTFLAPRPDLLGALHTSLTVASEAIGTVNHVPYLRHSQPLTPSILRLYELRSQLALQFPAPPLSKHELQAKVRTFAADGNGSLPLELRPLLLSLVYHQLLVKFTRSAVEVLTAIGELLEKREGEPKSRRRRRLRGPDLRLVTQAFWVEGDEDGVSHSKHMVNAMAEVLGKDHSGSTSLARKAMSWLKRLLLNFAYRNKIIWGLAAAQSGILINGICRWRVYRDKLTGAFAGVVVGLAVWYSGAQKTPGSGARLVIVWALVFAPVLWVRLFTARSSFAIALGMTAALIIGSAWYTTRERGASVGIGLDTGIRRWLLTIIGFAIAVLTMVLPPWPRAQEDRRTGNSTIEGLQEVMRASQLAPDSATRNNPIDSLLDAEIVLDGRRTSIRSIAHSERSNGSRSTVGSQTPNALELGATKNIQMVCTAVDFLSQQLSHLRAVAERLGSERPLAGSAAWRGDMNLTTLATSQMGSVSDGHV
ncbi:hypothetical protein T439DRAFT_357533 [Meredithblackwellia eburnea MCA 4105]